MAGPLSAVQLAQLKEAFDVADKDGDGEISGEDLRRVLKQLGEVVTSEESARALSRHDTKRTSTLDFVEFLALVAWRWRPEMERHGVADEQEQRDEAGRLFARVAGGAEVMSRDAFVAFARSVGERWAEDDEASDEANDAEAAATFAELTGGEAFMTRAQFVEHLAGDAKEEDGEEDGEDEEDEEEDSRGKGGGAPDV